MTATRQTAPDASTVIRSQLPTAPPEPAARTLPLRLPPPVEPPPAPLDEQSIDLWDNDPGDYYRSPPPPPPPRRGPFSTQLGLVIGLAVVAVLAIGAVAYALTSGAGSATKTGVSAPSAQNVTSSRGSAPAWRSASSTAAASAPAASPDSAGVGPTTGLAGYALAGAAVDPNIYAFAAESGQALQPISGSVEFITPSRNITCSIGQSPTPQAICVIAVFNFTSNAGNCSSGQWLTNSAVVGIDGLAQQGYCGNGELFPPIANVLNYGSTLRYNNFACRSESTYVACANVVTGHGFTMNRMAVQVS